MDRQASAAPPTYALAVAVVALDVATRGTLLLLVSILSVPLVIGLLVLPAPAPASRASWAASSSPLAAFHPLRVGGAPFTALYGVAYAIGFLVHEKPPTTGHVVAAVAVGFPAIAGLGVIAWHGWRWSDHLRRTLAVGLQGTGTAVMLGALAMQNTAKPLPLITVLVVVLMLPVALTAKYLGLPSHHRA